MDVEITTGLHRFEVWSERAVITSGDGDILAIEHVRIAPLSYINF